jgi:hypothetical protein
VWGNLALVASDDGFLYALSLGDGKVIWKHRGGQMPSRCGFQLKPLRGTPPEITVLRSQPVQVIGADSLPESRGVKTSGDLK